MKRKTENNEEKWLSACNWWHLRLSDDSILALKYQKWAQIDGAKQSERNENNNNNRTKSEEKEEEKSPRVVVDGVYKLAHGQHRVDYLFKYLNYFYSSLFPFNLPIPRHIEVMFHSYFTVAAVVHVPHFFTLSLFFHSMLCFSSPSCLRAWVCVWCTRYLIFNFITITYYTVFIFRLIFSVLVWYSSSIHRLLLSLYLSLYPFSSVVRFFVIWQQYCLESSALISLGAQPNQIDLYTPHAQATIRRHRDMTDSHRTRWI